MGERIAARAVADIAEALGTVVVGRRAVDGCLVVHGHLYCHSILLPPCPSSFLRSVVKIIGVLLLGS